MIKFFQKIIQKMKFMKKLNIYKNGGRLFIKQLLSQKKKQFVKGMKILKLYILSK